MDLAELKFPKSRLNIAVDDIVAQLAGIKDLLGKKVLQTVRPGIFIPEQMSEPKADETPACHIWHDSMRSKISSIQFLAQEVDTVISLYFTWYNHGRTGESMQALRQEMIEYVISRLQHPRTGNETNETGLVFQDNVWSWGTDWVLEIDHTNAYRRVVDQYILLPPWYATRVDLSITTVGLSDTFNITA